MKNKLTLALLIFAIGGCCKKKACAGDELPVITVKIAPVLQNQETVMLYTLEGEKKDSTQIPVDKDQPWFNIFPMHDFDDTQVGARQFIIRHQGRTDTIQRVAAVFRDFEIPCDNGWGCGRAGNGTQTIKKLMFFNLLCRGKNHAARDTVFLY